MLVSGHGDGGCRWVPPQCRCAHHHPRCGAGGPLTVTDANLCLGRLLPEYFPRIFGPGEDQPLCREAAAGAFRELAARIDAFQAGTGTGTGNGTGPHRPLSVEEVAMGFVRVANEAMCRPIRALTQVGWPWGGVGRPSGCWVPASASPPRCVCPTPVPGAGPRCCPPRVGLFRGRGGATRLRHRPRLGHEPRLHSQVGAGGQGGGLHGDPPSVSAAGGGRHPGSPSVRMFAALGGVEELGGCGVPPPRGGVVRSQGGCDGHGRVMGMGAPLGGES